jgi:zinc transport system substrate-binding protein
LAVALLAAILFGVGSMPSFAAEGPVRVTVTSKPIHSLVAQVMEGLAPPLLIVEGASSAHTFTLKPSAARAIAGSAMFIRVSERMEPFTRKLIEGLPKDVSVLTLADTHLGVTLLPQRLSGTFQSHERHEAHDHNDGHDEDADHGSAADGHLWLDPQNARAIVHAVAKALAAKWPQYAAQFKDNAAKADAALVDLEAELSVQLAPIKDKPFIVFHDAYQYFEHRFGVVAVGAVTLSPDQPPSAKRLTEVRQKLRTLHAACIFAEPQFQPKLLAAVTEGTTVRTGTLDPEGQALEPGPGLYAQLMRTLARDLASCLTPS